MKRYFVSVGSQSTEAMFQLISNLYAENLFSKYEDVFVAIDSDQGESRPWGKIRKLAGGSKRVHAVELKIEPDDAAVMDFCKDWTQTEISVAGVGGDRTLSEKARNWRKDLDEHVVEALEEKDQIFLMGSAFGGTSSGLYWNIADFLSDAAVQKGIRKGWKSGSVTLIGFVLLPDKDLDKGNPDYPLAPNICDFMRELQVTHWRRRLAAPSVFGITSPIYVREENGNVPLYRYDTNNKPVPLSLVSDDHTYSFLPVTTLYWIPTPSSKMGLAPALMAEQVFALVYIGVRGKTFISKAVDRWTSGGTGPKSNPQAEDPCFGGMRLLVYKSGRAEVIRKWFLKEWQEAERLLRTLPVADDIVANLRDAMADWYRRGKHDKDGSGAQGGAAPANAVLLEQFADSFLQQESWSEDTLKGYIDGAIGEGLPYPRGEIVDLIKELAEIKKPWMKNVGKASLVAAYKELGGETCRDAEAVEGLKTRLVALANNAWRKRETRRGSLIVKALKRQDAVEQEICEQFSRRFKDTLKALLAAARSKRSSTLRTLPSESEFEKRIDDIIKRLAEIGGADAAGSLPDNPYIVQGKSDVSLALPAGTGANLPLFTGLLLKAGLVDAPGERRTLIKAFEQDIQAEISVSIDAVIQDGGADPLEGATVAETTGLNGRRLFSEDLCANANEHGSNYRNTFAIVAGNLPSPFVLSNDDVKSRLGLDGFIAMQPLDHNFFGNDGLDVGRIHTQNPDEQTRAIFLNDGLKQPGARVALNGVWLGDVCEDFKLREILNTVFGVQTLDVWQQQVAMKTKGESKQRRLFTLSQMIFFGVIVRAIEEKASQAWSEKRHSERLEDYDVCLTFTHPKNTATAVRMDWMPARNAGLTFAGGDEDQRCIILDKLPRESVRKLAQWITKDEQDASGFYGWYFTPQRRENWKSVRAADLDVLKNGRLSILEDELKSIRDLQKAVADSLSVKIKLTGNPIMGAGTGGENSP